MLPPAHLCGALYAFLSIHSHTLDANLYAIEGPLVHITVTTRRKRVDTDMEKMGGNGV